MARVGEESDLKSKLVTEVCSISTRSIACAHRRRRCYPMKSPFIDWYLLLRVKEDAEIDIIRKQYRKLALQLHPDKNKHPKAEVAFKLVSEAYACLSDESKRKAFDSERWKSFCMECKRIPYETCNSPGNLDVTKIQGLDSRDRVKSRRILQGLRNMRDKFKEETRVIENCLRATEVCRKESPIFNPSDYLFQGYPHHRTPIYKKHEDPWYLPTRNIRNYDQGRGKCDSPIFKIKSETRPFQIKSACLSS
ncbi:hypothetical protein HHK36_022991 [Tetracentron sinense]|uniref:J domain-containing protein n=1 Tax=Tetracentron sinense TaxID=13715 RepID=A0A835D9D5_TETSI|nr:hypothetical protein HHK36_022991 [Tetracentron sinense]